MKKILVLTSCVFLATGCATIKENKKTAIGTGAGAAIGAGVGYAIGGGKGAAIGAGIGALTGGGIGYMMDRQEKEFKKALAESEAASIRREQRAIAEAKDESIKREQEVLILTFKSDFLFDFDSATLKPGAYSEIDRVAKIFNKYPETTIQIEGHTDNIGDEVYNSELSERRAMAVRNELVSKGVDGLRIEIIGFGEAKSVADNDSEGGRLMNRRVEIIIVPIKERSS